MTGIVTVKLHVPTHRLLAQLDTYLNRNINVFIKILGKSFDCFFFSLFPTFCCCCCPNAFHHEAGVSSRAWKNGAKPTPISYPEFWRFLVFYNRILTRSLSLSVYCEKISSMRTKTGTPLVSGKMAADQKARGLWVRVWTNWENVPFSGMVTPCKSYLTSKEKKQIPPMRIGSQKE